MPAAFFVVRATVTDPAKRQAFGEWYGREHLPDAAKAFGVKKAWRFWSLTDPSLHVAMYEFADQASLDRAMKGEDLKRLAPISTATGPISRARARCWCWRKSSGWGDCFRRPGERRDP
jgi:hypothetical protein